MSQFGKSARVKIKILENGKSWLNRAKLWTAPVEAEERKTGEGDDDL